MRQTSKGEGTKIAQAAKDLNVTSVTIRRYLSEFDIATTTDENGVKVLPSPSMEELKQIRKLKEDGLTNPKVMEILEQARGQSVKGKSSQKEPHRATARALEVEPEPSSSSTRPTARRIQKPERGPRSRAEKPAASIEPEVAVPEVAEESPGDLAASVRTKHSLTCQTCGQVFEHMNPRLRDCLDCYRTKRKERRRGSGERHKNVIQHPLAQQVTTKSVPLSSPSDPSIIPAVPVHRQSTVRNYRKAIEETRGLTSNLKRRLERPDLPEGERRWLEQIYAYQLILHQGWRHLAEYRSANQSGKSERQLATADQEGPNANGY